ncbi:MAG: S41 family peptidase [Planctomycetota bacterium]
MESLPSNPRLRRVLAGLASVAALLALGCRSFDPDVFDERLRAATVDAYVDAIETQFGGLEAAGLESGDLRERYREEAIAAETPAVFYAVLRAMLADLDDPHATLRVSSRFWAGPVAEPEGVRFVRSRDAIWIGAPGPSLRTDDELDDAMSRWLSSLGASSLAELDQRETATLLRLSSAYGADDRAWLLAAPLVWLRVHSIDGVAIETPHDAELMARGDLGTRARVVVEGRAGPTRLALLRNAGVFEDGPDGGVRRRLGPLELAALLDPGEGRGGTTARPPLRLRFRDPHRRPFRRGDRIDLPEAASRAFGAEAWILRTPRGRRVGYLRIGSFRPRDAQGKTIESSEEGSERPSLRHVLRRTFAALAPCEDLIVDLTGNPGGSWQEAGLFISYFQSPEDEVVPHEVASVAVTGNALFRIRTREVQRLERADVPCVLPRRVHVLVDQDTASAGEIAASAMRGLAGATVVGERTAGAEFSTAEFEGPDGSVLTIGLGGGMVAPLERFQGRGLRPDIAIEAPAEAEESVDLEEWRASYRYRALAAALQAIDEAALRDVP